MRPSDVDVELSGGAERLHVAAARDRVEAGAEADRLEPGRRGSPVRPQAAQPAQRAGEPGHLRGTRSCPAACAPLCCSLTTKRASRGPALTLLPDRAGAGEHDEASAASQKGGGAPAGPEAGAGLELAPRVGFVRAVHRALVGDLGAVFDKLLLLPPCCCCCCCCSCCGPCRHRCSYDGGRRALAPAPAPAGPTAAQLAAQQRLGRGHRGGASRCCSDPLRPSAASDALSHWKLRWAVTHRR